MVKPHGTLFGKPAWLVLLDDYDRSILAKKWCLSNLTDCEWLQTQSYIFYFTDKKQAVYIKLAFGGQIKES